jgi:hypothetical protein
MFLTAFVLFYVQISMCYFWGRFSLEDLGFVWQIPSSFFFFFRKKLTSKHSTFYIASITFWQLFSLFILHQLLFNKLFHFSLQKIQNFFFTLYYINCFLLLLKKWKTPLQKGFPNTLLLSNLSHMCWAWSWDSLFHHLYVFHLLITGCGCWGLQLSQCNFAWVRH